MISGEEGGRTPYHEVSHSSMVVGLTTVSVLLLMMAGVEPFCSRVWRIRMVLAV